MTQVDSQVSVAVVKSRKLDFSPGASVVVSARAKRGKGGITAGHALFLSDFIRFLHRDLLVRLWLKIILGLSWVAFFKIFIILNFRLCRGDEPPERDEYLLFEVDVHIDDFAEPRLDAQLLLHLFFSSCIAAFIR